MSTSQPRKHSSRCTCLACWSARSHCGHAVCLQSAIDAGDGRAVVCEFEEEDDRCIHGVSSEDHHCCVECAMERADAMLDLKREGS